MPATEAAHGTRCAAPLLLASLLLIPAGCRYRLDAPPSLPYAVAIDVATNQGRLVRAQAFLQQEVARAIQERLGWRIAPYGEARLELILDREEIDVATTDVDDIPNNWSMRINGQAMFWTPAMRRPLPPTPFFGIGYTVDREREPAGLRDAARNAAAQIADWLERNAETIVGEKPPPPAPIAPDPTAAEDG